MLTMTKPTSIHPQTAAITPLSTLNLFQKVPPAGLMKIREQMVEKTYLKSETIFLEDEPANLVWFVKAGHVKEVHHSVNGRSRTICTVGPNGLFGVSAFVGGNYGFHSIAETEVTVLSIPIYSLQGLMEKWPELAVAVLNHISKSLRKSKDVMRFAQETAEKRLLHVLVEMAGDYGNAIPLSRKEIAEMAGVAVETCIRTFKRLEGEGSLVLSRNRILVRDLDDLKERIGII